MAAAADNQNRFAVRLLVNAGEGKVSLWHLQKANFIRSFPSWERASIFSYEELPGKRVRFTLQLERFFRKKRIVFVVQYLKDNQALFIKQESGYLKKLELYIEIKPVGENLYELIERVDYELRCPMWFISSRKNLFNRRCKRFFDYKHDLMLKDLREKPVAKSLQVLVTGSHGLIGSNLVAFLESMGHKVSFLSFKDRIEKEKLEGFDAVVHLAGKSIQCRWSKTAKQEILESRVMTTRLLAEALSELNHPPKVFLSASAVGYYGDSQNALVDESYVPYKKTFLSHVCEAWESASNCLKTKQVRICYLRFGMVLSSQKGALFTIGRLFRFGLLGRLGTGEQYMSWIAIDDALSAIHHIITHTKLEGPINVTSPHPVENKEFSAKLAHQLKKPLGPNAPAFLLKLFNGEMAEEVLLASLKVIPKKLLESGYEFRYPYLDEALSHLI